MAAMMDTATTSTKEAKEKAFLDARMLKFDSFTADLLHWRVKMKMLHHIIWFFTALLSWNLTPLQHSIPFLSDFVTLWHMKQGRTVIPITGMSAGRGRYGSKIGEQEKQCRKRWCFLVSRQGKATRRCNVFLLQKLLLAPLGARVVMMSSAATCPDFHLAHTVAERTYPDVSRR